MLKNLETVSELANRLKVPRSWVYGKTRKTGPEAIPKIQIGKYIRFNPEAVDRWIVEQFSNSSE